MRRPSQTLRTFPCFVQISFTFHATVPWQRRAHHPCIFTTANRAPHTRAFKAMVFTWKNGGGDNAVASHCLWFTPRGLAA